MPRKQNLQDTSMLLRRALSGYSINTVQGRKGLLAMGSYRRTYQHTDSVS